MRKQLVPNKTQLRRYLAQGLTQQQIVEAWERDSGIRVSRPAIAMAMSRYSLPATNPRARHEDTIPWVLQPRHRSNLNARMLRLEGRRRKGLPLKRREQERLDSYVATLKRLNAVVTYIPGDPQGFLWVERHPTDNDLVRVHPLPPS